jgi:SWI/SNF-related matrix-associated actin-dependent regulator of chromatin subfamily A-like protein 1
MTVEGTAGRDPSPTSGPAAGRRYAAVTFDPALSAPPPSAEVLGDLARRVADAYPDLYAHQRSGVAFLLSRRRAILADDMGLGKTRQAIVAVREVVPDGPYLVICPAGVRLNWRREIHLVEPDGDVHVITGSGGWEPGHRWTVVNYDLLGRLEEELHSVPWAGIVVDEAHYIKNRSQRSARVLHLLGVGAPANTAVARPAPRVAYLLTGTPMASRPRDLFNLLKAVEHPLAQSFYAYAIRYCAAHHNGYGLDSTGASNLEELARIVSGVLLRRTKDEALDLPPKVRTWLPVEVNTNRAVALEARALDYLRDHPSRGGPTWVTFLGMLNRARHALGMAKVPATAELVGDIIDAGHKVVVYSGYTGVVTGLAERFGAAAVTVTGADTAARRQAAVDALQRDPSVRVLLGNIHAAGVGINLTAATHVLFNDLDWVPGNHWQAEDRIYRIGQTSTAFATYLYAPGTLDGYVAALLEEKARTIGVLEAEAADRATLLDQVVEGALTGTTPDEPPGRSTTATAAPNATMGLLEETLDLLARTTIASPLADPDAGERRITVPSRSRPGRFYTVVIAGGVVRCDCPGFAYRGNCVHAREAIDP